MRATAMARSVRAADRYCAAGSLLKTRNAALQGIIRIYVLNTYVRSLRIFWAVEM